MAFNHDVVASWKFAPVVQTIEPSDCFLYALSVGVGRDPLNRDELPFVYGPKIKVLPTMAAVVCTPGFWAEDPRLGIDITRIFHGEQSVTLHKPIPPGEELTGHSRISDLIDKGPGGGAIIEVECVVRDSKDQPVWTVNRTAFLKGEGGFGGTNRSIAAPAEIPGREPDQLVDILTTGDQALLNRLNGDFNPLHADPDVAERAGFPQPILHGLCTYGITGYALLKAVCDYDVEKFGRLSVRFSAPTLPGDTLRIEIWRNGEVGAFFRCRAVERDVTVIASGRFDFAKSL